MIQYTVITGDTFELIARKTYGSESDAGFIARANPGVMEPLTPGVIIITPIKPGAPTDLTSGTTANNENEVALSIDGKRFRFWESIVINKALDSFSTIEFTAPFEPENLEFRDAFKPLSYKRITVTVGGEPFFTGTMVIAVPTLSPDRRTVSVNGYALPGVLNDCSIPASAFPLEFNDQGLQEIARTIAEPFGLSVEFEASQGAVFERVAAEPGKKALQFLIELAKQRSLVISNTAEGKLLFRQSVSSSAPVARLAEGTSPVMAVTPQFNAQNYYSHITGLQPAILGVGGSQYTAENPRLKGTVRPLTFTADDTLTGDAKEAVDAKISRMFADVVKYSINVSTWRDSRGALWRDNTTITLVALGVMVYTEYKFIIRSVEFSKDETSEAAVLNVALPGVFEGKIPDTMPWD